jgi:hypothetical protein
MSRELSNWNPTAPIENEQIHVRTPKFLAALLSICLKKILRLMFSRPVCWVW